MTWDKELLKEWNELEEIIGLAQMERLRAIFGKMLEKLENLEQSRELWKQKYKDEHGKLPSID